MPERIAAVAAVLLACCAAPPHRPDGHGRPVEDTGYPSLSPHVTAGHRELADPGDLGWAYQAARDAVPGLEPDERLASAAEAVLELVARSSEVPPRQIWVREVRQAGVAEPVPALLVVSAARGEGGGLEAVLRTRLEERVRGLACNLIGLAHRRSGPVETMVALVVTSHLTLEPVPLAVRRGASIRLRGETSGDIEEVTILVATPAGRVEEIETASGRRFDVAVTLEERGPNRIEVLGRHEGSPVVLANFAVVVEGHGSGPSEPPPGATADPGAARERLLELLGEARRRAGVDAVDEHHILVAAAMAYAEDMATRGFFGHVDPEGRGPGERVAAAGLRAPLVLENLSRAPTAEEAHVGLVDSPAHLRSMLDPEATHVGIGVHGDEDHGLWVVELMARVVPQVSPEVGAHRVLRSMAAARRRGRAPELTADPALAAAAGAAADLVAAGTATAEEALEAARARMSSSLPRALRAVVVRTADLDDTGDIDAATDPALTRVGIAVRPAADEGGGYHVVILLAPR